MTNAAAREIVDDGLVLTTNDADQPDHSEVTDTVE